MRHDEGNHDTFQPIKLMPILFITTYILGIIGVNIAIIIVQLLQLIHFGSIFISAMIAASIIIIALVEK